MAADYACVRELRPYSLAELSDKIGQDGQRTLVIVQRLLDCGIVRYRTGTEQGESDAADETGATDEQRYQFRYVGIALVGATAFVCFPKYIRSDKPPVDELRFMLRVVRKLDGFGELPQAAYGENPTNRLAVMVRLLELYEEHGIYDNYEDSRDLNGNGVIDWGRTIDTIAPVLTDGQPVYLDYWTRKTRRDESDLVTRLHRAILTECSRFLCHSGIAGLLRLSEIELTDETPDDLGDADELDWRLERERASQFVTWRQETIDLMRLYLGEGGIAAEADRVLCMGTTAYYHAWELACKVAFGDLLDKKLGNLPIELAGGWRGKAGETLLQIIPRPLWERPSGVACGDVDTLIPDTVTFVRGGDGSRLFCIYDAKYYVPSENGRMTGQPGVESVTKQFLYQSAYRSFVLDHGFDHVVNAFLVPSEGNEPRLLATVTFPGVVAKEASPFGNCIGMVALPAHDLFDCFLRDMPADEQVMQQLLLILKQ
jgi:hypothetical protein